MANFGRKDYNLDIDTTKIEKDPEEPMLLIRGSDEYGPVLVDLLAERMEQRQVNWRVVDAVRVLADDFRQYQKGKLDKQTTLPTVDERFLPGRESSKLTQLRKARPELFHDDGKGAPKWVDDDFNPNAPENQPSRPSR